MPFMKGASPIRRTWKYLEQGKIFLKESVKIVSINYNSKGDGSEGARKFVFWHLPQLQFQNPKVQVVTMKNMTPTPFIKCYLDTDEQVLVDLDHVSSEEIHDHLKKILGKSKSTLEAEASAAAEKHNPGIMGWFSERQCICEVPGQVPCPRYVKLPDHMRGKHKYSQATD